MRQLKILALLLVFSAESHVWAWQNPLVSVSSPTSQAEKGVDGTSTTSWSTINKNRKKRKKKLIERVEQKEEQVASSDHESAIGFAGTVAVDHTGGFNKDVDPVSTLNLGLQLKLHNIYQLGVSQSISKLYAVNEGENEVLPEDTVFSIGARLYSSPGFLTISQSFSATAPISEASRQYEITSRIAENTTFSFAIIEKRLTLSLTPGATYTFNRYATTPTSLDGGGRPLQQSTIGLGGSLAYQVTDKWDMNLSGGFKQIFYEKVEYENEVSDLGLTNPPNHAYAFSIGTSYTFFDALNLSISMAQADRIEKEGGIEVLIYDEYATLWSLGMTYSF